MFAGVLARLADPRTTIGLSLWATGSSGIPERELGSLVARLAFAVRTFTLQTFWWELRLLGIEIVS